MNKNDENKKNIKPLLVETRPENRYTGIRIEFEYDDV